MQIRDRGRHATAERRVDRGLRASVSPLPTYSEAPNKPASSAGSHHAAATAAAAYLSRTVSRTCSTVAFIAVVEAWAHPAEHPHPLL
jgi:hypothetical protein